MAYEVSYDQTKVELVLGDLLEEEVEAIINPANSLMIMGGGVAGAIKRKGGEDIEKEAMRYAPVPVGKAVLTNAGKLKAKYVIHSPTMERPAMLTTKEKVYEATRAALILAREKGIKSLAIPAMGAGVGGLSYRESAEAMLRAIKELFSGIERIRIVVRDEEAFKEFKEVMQELK